jgi:hypothetical protein
MAQTPNRRVSWEGIAALTAILSLVAALVFNGVQVMETRRVARETRDATELQVFTQLHSLIAGSSARVVPTESEWTTGTLTPADDAKLGLAGNNMEFLAWLFNEGRIGLDGARALWGPAMRCMYEMAGEFGGEREAAVDWPNLHDFVATQRCPAPTP